MNPIGRLARELREAGPGPTANKVLRRLKRTVYRYEYLRLVRASDLTPAPEPLPHNLRVEMVDFDALEEGRYFKAIETPAEVRARFARGYKCIAVYVGDELAHVSWLTVGHLPIDPGIPDLVGDGIGGAFDVFTRRDLRGNRCLSHALGHMKVAARELGLTRLLAVIHPDNAPSLHVFGKMGFEVIGDVEYRRVLFSESFDHPDAI